MSGNERMYGEYMAASLSYSLLFVKNTKFKKADYRNQQKNRRIGTCKCEQEWHQLFLHFSF